MRGKTIYITETDKARFDWLMLFSEIFGGDERKTMRKLNFAIAQAHVVRNDEIPADAVTTYSQVVLQEVGGDNEFTATLVFPDEAEEDAKRISVLDAAGMALIGSRTGDVIEFAQAGVWRKLIGKNTTRPPAAMNGQCAGRRKRQASLVKSSGGI
jgi:regulator of nucleoside diphosphate kinase